MIEIIMPNLVGVLIATIVSFVIGAVWFAPQVMGRMWMNLLGKNEEMLRKNRNKAIVFGFLANLLTAYLLGVFVKAFFAADWLDGAEVGFLAWLAFSFTIHFTSYIFEDRPVKLFGIDAAHQLVIFVVMGAILGIWA
ncbi:MAG: DUF1761 domain-containing protein [archaeon]|nr:MAG: DUF1761 domain-containing protein [archaeon]